MNLSGDFVLLFNVGHFYAPVDMGPGDHKLWSARGSEKVLHIKPTPDDDLDGR